MKYIRINVDHGAIAMALVLPFPKDLVHAIVAKHMLAACKEQWPNAKATVMSAGDINLYSPGTSGWSESLQLHNHPDDSLMLNSSDYGGHIL